jgi:ankyrin repeat protein
MLLLHRGADTGAATPRGTALQVAATRAHPDIIAILLRHGADVCPLPGWVPHSEHTTMLLLTYYYVSNFHSQIRLQISTSHRWLPRSSVDR